MKKWLNIAAGPGAILILTALWLTLYQDLIFPWGQPRKLLSYDYSLQFYPWLNYSLHSFLRGEIPWWCHLAACGEPFAGKLETAPFFPLRLTLLPLMDGGRIPFYAAQLYQVISVLISGMGTYLILRQLGCLGIAAVIGGALWLASWDIANHLVYISFSEEIMVFPFMLLFYLKALQKKSYACLAAAGILTGLCLLAGNPYWALLHLMFLGAIGLTLNWESLRLFFKPPNLLRLIWPLAFLVVTGLLIASILLIPSWELYQHSPRSGTGIGFASSDRFNFGHIVHRLLLDNPFGRGGFFLFLAGMAPFLLRRRLVFLFSLVAVLAADMTRGSDSLVFTFFYYVVPGFGMFRFPGRMLHLCIFALILLGGLAFARLWQGGGRPLWLSLLGAGLVGWVITLSGEASQSFVLFSIIQLLALGVCLLVWPWDKARQGILLMILAGSVIFPAYFPLSDGKWIARQEDFYAVTPQVAFLKKQIPQAAFRVSNIGGLISHKDSQDFWKYLKHNFRGGLLWGIPTWSSNAALHLRDLDKYAAQTRYGRLYDLLGIRYLVLGFDKPLGKGGKYEGFRLGPGERVQLDLASTSDEKPNMEVKVKGGPLEVEFRRGHKALKTNLRTGMQSLEIPGQGRLLEIKGINGSPVEVISLDYQDRDLLEGSPRWRQVFPGIYENTFAVPKGVLVHHYTVHTPPGGVLKALYGLEPELSVVLEEEPVFPREAGLAPSASDKVVLLKNEPHRLEFQCGLKEKGLLVINDAYYPGWKARVNGSPVKLLKADFLFQAVPLSPGEHKVLLTYEPWWRPWAMLLPMLGMALALAVPYCLSRLGLPLGPTEENHRGKDSIGEC